ncbi:MAG: hypothetical protein KF830_12515 [Planctomycetes bacterium]|nr:hypothetical protein [Planctomycetota bacterium]
MARILRCFLALQWTLLAIGKHAVRPAEPASDLPEWVLLAASAIELVVAVALLTRWHRSACWIGMAFCLVAMALVAIEPSGTCPCIGGLPSGGRVRFVVAGGLGTMCATLLLLEARAPAPVEDATRANS